MNSKRTTHIIKGLQCDFSPSKQTSEYAVDAKNIRLTDRGDSTLLSITNEKGTKAVMSPSGVIIGKVTFLNYLVIFSTNNTAGYITIFDSNKEDRLGRTLCKDTNNSILGFTTDTVLETLVEVESPSLVKIYYLDGVNSPRVIILTSGSNSNYKISNANIDASGTLKSHKFDFNPKIALKETTLKVTPQYNGGTFTAGIIQYTFNYYTKYGAETPLIETSPLEYITFRDRGAEPGDNITNSFKIDINDIDSSFDGIRIYSIHRTSLDAVPTVKMVADLEIGNLGDITYVDTGNRGEIIDPTKLLFVGGDKLIPRTFAKKDGTLFLGNISIKEDVSNPKVNISYIKETEGTSTSENAKSTYYPYSSYTGTKRTTFKSGEYYRLGVQFQDKYGKWHDPIPLKDYQIKSKPKCSAQDDGKVTFSGTNLKAAIDISNNSDNYFVKARPVIVYPQDSERAVVAQGILNPTVFNYYNRKQGFLDAQSSWFFRPYYRNLAMSLQTEASVITYNSNPIECDYNLSPYLKNKYYGSTFRHEGFIKQGSEVESRHYYSLPPCWSRSCEIQSNRIQCVAPSQLDNNPNLGRETFFIDKSILTFHSPEIELGKVQDLSGLKLRLIGIASLTARASEIDIQLSSAGLSPDSKIYNGYYESTWPSRGSKSYPKQVISGLFYFDEIYKYGDNDPTFTVIKIKDQGDSTNANLKNKDNCPITPFMVYPWQKKGSINNDTSNTTANLKTKKLSNLRYFGANFYFNNEDTAPLVTSDIQLFTSDTIRCKTPSQIYNKKPHYTYNGNIDQLITPYTGEGGYYVHYWSTLYKNSDGDTYSTGYRLPYNIGYPYCIGSNQTNYILNGKEWPLYQEHKNESDSYLFNMPVTTFYNTPIGDRDNMDEDNVFISEIQPKKDDIFPDTGEYISRPGSVTSQVSNTDPISIKYKSTPHAVCVLDDDINIFGENSQQILPSISDDKPSTNGSSVKHNFTNDYTNDFTIKDIATIEGYTIKRNKIKTVDISNLTLGNFKNSQAFYRDNYLWIAELYRDNVEGRFGGDFDTIQDTNMWYPAGPSKILSGSDAIILQYTQGDTFFARFDSLKTYMNSLEETNSITEIGSFMVETRINLDARYDRNRGKVDNTVMSPNNFNLFNDVYNQKDNFFNYRVTDKHVKRNTEFPNSIVWSQQKFANSLVDPWTSINMVSSIDLDGTKGPLTKLETFNNEVLAFQQDAINHVLFNTRVQIPTSDNVPIEISNSYKVEGVKQVSDIGSDIKESIKSTPSGLYYINDETKGLYLFNGQNSVSLSDTLGMSSWVKKQDLKSFRTDYDKVNRDVYFINPTNCLGYSEKLGQFESFFSYEDSEIFNIEDRTYAIKGGDVHQLFAGEYNSFFGSLSQASASNYWITIIHNENPLDDKIYNNLEFRADSYANNALEIDSAGFNTIRVWNEYQDTKEIPLDFKCNIPSNLKRKFRVWRANIPRDYINKRDRIRNTWTKITLKAVNPGQERVELHDLTVNYFM